MSSRTYRIRGVARPALSFPLARTRGVNGGEWDRPSGEDAALEHFASGSEIEPRLIRTAQEAEL
jgi:hypothetical protein